MTAAGISTITRERGAVLRSRGMTLVEILVVMVIMAVMVAVVVVGSGQTNTARLRQGAALVTGAVRVAFSKSSARAKPLRLVFDFSTQTIGIEESDDVMLLAKNDSTGGAAPMTELEQQALEESKRIVSGPKAPRASFHPLDSAGFGVTTPGKGPKPLPRNIAFRRVQCEHEETPRFDGRGYLYFFPGGQTERCIITLGVGLGSDSDADNSLDTPDTLSLIVSPLTGKVTVKPGVHALELPESDQEASERGEPGGTL